MAPVSQHPSAQTRQTVLCEPEGCESEEGVALPSLEHLALDALLQEAQQEILRFRRQQKTTSRAAFEVFRRALLLRDDAAWAGLYQLYAPLIEAWILLRSPGMSMQRYELAWLVNETFAKFARALPAEKWPRFSQTRKLLAYLKCCAVTVATDAWRLQQHRSREASLEAIDHEQSPLIDDPAEVVIQHLVLQELWQVAAGIANCEQEHLILQQHFARGVPLQELPRRYPELFPTMESVYGLKSNLLQRLRRNHAVQQAATLCEAHAARQRPTKKRGAYPKGIVR